MKKLNYAAFMAAKPMSYGTVVNQLGQTIEFYEHPIMGDEYPVVAVYHEERAAYATDFFDTDDFHEGSEYNPCYKDGDMESAYCFGLGSDLDLDT